jgi:hypothetical protein
MKYPSLSHLSNVSLKSTLSDISIGTPAYFQGPLANLLPAFHPKPVLVSVNKWVSCKQHIVGSSFSIQFAKWCILMGKLSLLTFSVNIDRYVVISVL